MEENRAETTKKAKKTWSKSWKIRGFFVLLVLGYFSLNHLVFWGLGSPLKKISLEDRPSNAQVYYNLNFDFHDSVFEDLYILEGNFAFCHSDSPPDGKYVEIIFHGETGTYAYRVQPTQLEHGFYDPDHLPKYDLNGIGCMIPLFMLPEELYDIYLYVYENEETQGLQQVNDRPYIKRSNRFHISLED